MLRDRLAAYYASMGKEREPALDRLGDYFHQDIHFVDPFRDTHGMADFRKLFDRMFKQYRVVEFTGFVGHGDDEAFTLRYQMRLKMAVGPVFTTDMVSLCRARDGKVFELVDVYDMTSSLVSPFGLLRRLYRAIINALFL